MHIAILGRQPALSMAELERIYGSDAVNWFSNNTATVAADALDISQLGGTLKAGRIVIELSEGDWRRVSMSIVRHYTKLWNKAEGKLTLGISAHGFDATPRDIQKTGIVLKRALKEAGTSLRLIPNNDMWLNTATSHHNKLGLAPNKVELLVIRGESGRIIIAESTGAQNITALAARDQKRPRRDPFVGMLPPKLAQIMINLAAGQLASQKPATVSSPVSHRPILLDPFCGTGVILQEAALLGYAVRGTDLSDKMVLYTTENLSWLATSRHLAIDASVRQADAMAAHWQPPIDLVVSETYLGQPFSAPPSPEKLDAVRANVNRILVTFLKNIRHQLDPGTPLCLAVPAWRNTTGQITRLPFLADLPSHGYTRIAFRHVSSQDLLYYREDQVVARELLVIARA